MCERGTREGETETEAWVIKKKKSEGVREEKNHGLTEWQYSISDLTTNDFAGNNLRRRAPSLSHTPAR